MSFKEILETLPTIELNRTSAQQGVEWFAEHVEDAKANPGKHPNIDLLFKVINENLNLTLIPLC